MILNAIEFRRKIFMILIPVATNWYWHGDLENEIITIEYYWDIFLLVKFMIPK